MNSSIHGCKKTAKFCLKVLKLVLGIVPGTEFDQKVFGTWEPYNKTKIGKKY